MLPTGLEAVLPTGLEAVLSTGVTGAVVEPVDVGESEGMVVGLTSSIALNLSTVNGPSVLFATAANSGSSPSFKVTGVLKSITKEAIIPPSLSLDEKTDLPKFAS